MADLLAHTRVFVAGDTGSYHPSMLMAVDIVLLPDSRATETFVAWNATLLESCDGAVRLAEVSSPGRGLPHLSLCMGVLDSVRVAAVGDALAPLADEVVVRPRGFHESTHGGQPVASLQVDGDDGLRRLHEDVLDVTEGLLDDRPATAEMFVEEDVDPVLRASTEWVTDYRSRAAGDRFDPHVTLGYGAVSALARAAIPDAVRFDALALFQLGASCTCRRALWRSDR